MSRYLISKYGDPAFALTIGATAAWSRIRREELERFHETSPSAVSQISQNSASRQVSPDQITDNEPTPPTATDTLNTIATRIGNIKWNPREWDFQWSDLWKRKDTWGIVDPNR